MGFRDEIRGAFLTDDELRAGVTLTFLEEEPEAVDGDYGTQRVWRVKVEGFNRRFGVTSERLLDQIGRVASLKDKTFFVKRSGQKYEIAYEFEQRE